MTGRMTAERRHAWEQHLKREHPPACACLQCDALAELRAVEAERDAARAEEARLRAALERIGDTPPETWHREILDIARAALAGERAE